MKLKQYDIILKKNSKQPISKLIYFYTKGIYNHSEIYLGNFMICDAMPNGVKVRPFDSSLNEFDAYRYYRKLTDREKNDIQEFIQKNINCKYDFVELILQALHIKKKPDRKFICISLITEAFKYAGVEIDEWAQGFSQISDSKYFYKVNRSDYE